MRQQKSLKELIAYCIYKEKETDSHLPPAVIKEIMVDNQEMYQYIQQQYEDHIRPLMVQIVEEGQARGEITDKVSVQAVLLAIQIYMKSSGEMLDGQAAHEDREAFVEELIHIFFYGLCGREPQ